MRLIRVDIIRFDEVSNSLGELLLFESELPSVNVGVIIVGK